MDSSIIKISQFLTGAKTLKASGFSVGFSFDAKKAEDYFLSLIQHVNTEPIFAGILIMESLDSSYTIIDGSQRLITINLLLHALCENYKGTTQKNEEAGSKILNHLLLFNGRPKLELSGIEGLTFEKIILSQEIDEDEKNTNLYITYQTFLSLLKQNKVTGTELFQIISSMQFMLVLTDKSEVSSRDLYQVLNENKGESQMKLIADFLRQKSNEAYMTWENIINKFKGSRLSAESFIVDFLITRSENPSFNKGALYNNFKNYYNRISKYQDLAEILDTLERYSQYYLKILNADFESIEVKQQVELLSQSGGRETYPYLMEVLDDLENAHISESAFLNILMMINLFIANRQELSISNMNIDFSSLSKELNKMLVLKDYVPKMLSENKLTINEINILSNFEV